MTSRERVLTALNHKEPDKLPVDCGAMRSTGIMGIAYNDLKRHLGIEHGVTKIYDSVQQLAIPEQWFLDRFQIDSIDLARAFSEDVPWQEWKLPDGSDALFPGWLDFAMQDGVCVCRDAEGEIIAEMPASTTYFSQTIYPYYQKQDDDFSQLGAAMNKSCWSYMTDPLWMHASEGDFYETLRKKAKALHDSTDKVIMMGIGCNLFEWGQFLYRTDEFLMNLMLEQERTEYFLDRLVDQHLTTLDKVLDAVSPYVHVLQFGDDLGTQNSPMISPDLYNRMFLPRHKKIFSRVKEKTDIKVFLHSCGAIHDLIPSLIDAGVDILNPVQIGADGMAPEIVKKEFGKDLVFWGGGVDTQHVLPNGTPDEVRDEVLKNTEILMKDGGFVFNQVHNIVAGIKPENIVAMYDAANSVKY